MAVPRELVRVAVILMTFFLFFHRSLPAADLPAALPSTAAGNLCVPRERDALLDLKAGLTDPDNFLSSWRGAECCLWTGVYCSQRTGHVVSLEINSYNQTMSIGTIGGEIRSSLLTLRHLHKLHISFNDFRGKPIPEFIGSLRKLKYLDLYSSNFGGRIPPHIGNLSNLQVLHLDNNMVSSSTDLTWVSGLSNLQSLDMSGADLSAAVDWAHAINMLPNLIELNLVSCGLRNPTPTLIHSNLTLLESLDLSSNPFNASTRDNIFYWSLPRLQDLSLQSCGIHGPIPDAVGNLTSVQYLALFDNYFIGTLPWTLKKLKKLQELNIGNNFISMDVTELLHQLPTDELQEVFLESNNLTGSLPARLPHFTNLDTINLDNNKLSGEIPVGTWKHTNLKVLRLSSNNLHGTITKDHFLFGGMQLETLDISSNQLDGPIPTLPGNLSYLDLSGNNLSSTLPSDIGAPMLQVLLLFNNSFSGTIPCSLLQLQYLTILDLSKNLLDGTLPNCLQGYMITTMIILNNNNLSGAFPLFIQRCRQLTFLDLAYNKFSGSLPTWIDSKLPRLALLRLRSNILSGAIPRQITMMKELQYLDIACNNVSGNIPQSLGNLTAMTITPNNDSALFQTVNFEIISLNMYIGAYTDSLLVDTKGQQLEYTNGIAYMVFIDFSCNNLTGMIPQDIGMLIALKNLNLSWNSLIDIIPQSIGELRDLESFDLSHNQLCGEIPIGLSALTSLSNLNLSYNNLTGKIPSGNQLRTLDDQESIYIGNPGLCGPPLVRNCSGTAITPLAPEEDESLSHVDSVYLSVIIGFVAGLWIVFCGLLFKRNWRVACFSFSDNIYDQVYVQVAVCWASLARKICRG